MSQETKVLDTNQDKNIESFEDLLEFMVDRYPAEVCEKLKEVYEFSEKAHRGQIRRSGEPYISHPIGVAGILDERFQLARQFRILASSQIR